MTTVPVYGEPRRRAKSRNFATGGELTGGELEGHRMPGMKMAYLENSRWALPS